MADPNRAVAMLEQLHGMGLKLSIDDFGTGYSSLSHLNRLPIHEVKIDRSFVKDLPAGPDAIIVEATITLAHRLGKRVVAEGVETQNAWHWLHDMGCDEAQGYLLSHPLTAAALTTWLRNNDPADRCATAETASRHACLAAVGS